MARSTGKAGRILMMLVDTNVLSAMMHCGRTRWFDAQPPESVWTTTITVSKLGRRRDLLHDALDLR
jgi:predicted nucleic acid-binding protein